jgi:hypothetical protein
MEQWEHNVLSIVLDRKSATWWMQGPGNQRITGSVSQLLDSVGQDGWELVNVIADRWHPTEAMGAGGDVVRLMAFFKRRAIR